MIGEVHQLIVEPLLLQIIQPDQQQVEQIHFSHFVINLIIKHVVSGFEFEKSNQIVHGMDERHQ
jgi:hypothetical protein